MLFVIIADVITKNVAVATLVSAGTPRQVIGDLVRFTLVYNPGAAFGLEFGDYSRWIFMALTVGALVILARLYRHTESGDLLRVTSIAFVAAGAIGNLIDRVRSEFGVVDFIDVGVGAHRWPTFNIADMAVSGGALLLAYVLWDEERRHERLAATGGTAPPLVPLAAAEPLANPAEARE